MDRNKALEKAEQLKRNKQSEDIIELLQPFYSQKKTIDIACYLIYAYRRLGEFNTCYKICNEIEAVSGISTRITFQRKWIKLFEKVISNTDIPQMEQHAKSIMTELNTANNYDYSIAKYLCFYIAKTLEYKNTQKAIEWLQKLNPHKLNNKVKYFVMDDEGSYDNEIRRVNSEKMIYYLKFIDLLKIGKMLQSWIKNSLSDYSSSATSNMITSINNYIFYSDGNVNSKRLAKILMMLTEDVIIMKSAVSTDIRGLFISDVSNFVFCPVSFAIKKTTFPVESFSALDYDEEMSFHRKYLNDIYEIYNNNNRSFEKAFDKILKDVFTFSKNEEAVLIRIFNSNRIGKNTSNSPFMNYYFQNSDISGSPDMYLEDIEKYLVEEVYTGKSLSQLTSAYENDVVKMTGYLYEMNLNFGYLFYWNTEPTHEGKEISSIICGVKIFKIVKSSHIVNRYLQEKQTVKAFLQNGHFAYSSSHINHNKCVNCSVALYCIHKKGALNSIKLPYKDNYAALS